MLAGAVTDLPVVPMSGTGPERLQTSDLTIETTTPVTPAFTYQGRLTTSAGAPISGSPTVRFSLYTVPSGGSAVSIDTHPVTVTNGLFTTSIAASDPAIINGQALWLGIQVGTDPEMTPRQEIRAVPYAMSLMPGAVIQGDDVDTPALWLFSPGVGLYAEGAYSGLQGYSTGQFGVVGVSSGDQGMGVYGQSTGPEGAGVVGLADQPGSQGVWGYSEQDAGISGIGKTGGFFTTNQAGTHPPGFPAVNISTLYTYNPGVRISTTGTASRGIDISTSGSNSAGVFAETWNTTSYGFYALTHGDYADGVNAITQGRRATAVYASTAGAESPGVYVDTSNLNSPGIFAQTWGRNSPAIRGESSQDVGVSGKSTASAGVYGESQSGTGVSGIGKEGAFFTTNQAGGSWPWNAAVNVSTVYTNNPGITIHTKGIASDGVTIETEQDGSSGVFVKTWGDDAIGVYAMSVKTYGIMAQTAAQNDIAIYTPNTIWASNYVAPQADIAEYMRVTADVAPGTVLVIAKGGVLQPSTTPYDTRVAGIVSTAPGVSLGIKEAGNPGEALIAIAGKVPCLVDASNGPIAEGDLLTTSSRPGHAMKAEPVEIQGRKFYPDGTILGKAMGALESGTGTIEVIVTLQ
jgi:hypothetical protein